MRKKTSIVLNESTEWYLAQTRHLTGWSMTTIIGQALYFYYHRKVQESVQLAKEKKAAQARREGG